MDEYIIKLRDSNLDQKKQQLANQHKRKKNVYRDKVVDFEVKERRNLDKQINIFKSFQLPRVNIESTESSLIKRNNVRCGKMIAT